MTQIKKQNPMNTIVKVKETDGFVRVLEVSPSQLSHMQEHVMEGLDRKERKAMRIRLDSGEIFRTHTGQTIKILEPGS